MNRVKGDPVSEQEKEVRRQMVDEQEGETIRTDEEGVPGNDSEPVGDEHSEIEYDQPEE